MKGQKRNAILFATALILPSILYAHKEIDLPKKYERWVKEEVVYIVTPKEKEVFYDLENDRDRDLFIEEFWRQRDPTPGTSRNEFKEEHYRRIEYANEKFGRGTPVDGWRTDRGRFYIMLGRPAQVEKYMSPDIYPVEVWYYNGNPAIGQAASYRLLFFQKFGSGEYELYDPASDGPKSLVPFYTRDHLFKEDMETFENFQTTPLLEEEKLLRAQNVDDRDILAFQILKYNVGVELAEASFSNFPGRTGPQFRLPSTMLIHEVDTYPHKKVNDDYAYDFLEHKAVVEVSYSVHYITNFTKVSVLQDPSGLFFVNYIIVPETLSVDLFQDTYFTSLRTSFRLTDAEGKSIFQGGRDVPIELRKDELKLLEKNTFQFCDSFPLIPGNYTFDFLMENTVTREFTSFEKDISVPEGKGLQMSPFILARKVNKDSPYSQSNRAFQVGSLQIYPSVNNTFLTQDTLFLFFQIYGLSRELKEEGQLVISFYTENGAYRLVHRNMSGYEHNRDFLEEISLQDFAPGKYTVIITLHERTGRDILSQRETIYISQKPFVGSWVVAQTNPPAEDPFYSYILGNQFLNKGDLQKAYDELEGAYEARPDSLEYALSYARVLFTVKKPQRVKEILLPFVETQKETFGLYYSLGKASQELGELEEAISFFQKALSHRGDIAEILNSIGDCYLALGNMEQALRTWEKSLEINPDQEKIKKVVEALKKK